MSGPVFFFAGGGTGGHLYPGLAVAGEVQRLRPDATIVFACSSRDIDRRILDPLDYAVVPQPVRPMPRGLRGWGSFLLAWRRSALLAADMVRDLRPQAVLGLGGYAAAPLVRRASAKGIRAGMLNPDAVPGIANRLLARHTDAIFAQFASTADAFPARCRGKVRHTGCPVRRELLGASRDEALKHFDLDGARRTLLVFGASLGAASINMAVAALAGEMERFADSWQVLHVTGQSKIDSVTAPGARLRVRTVDYCHRMDLAYAAADLALCRSGASTIAELTATGTPAVLMPYPHHRDRQQYLNAQQLVQAGAALVVDDRIEPAANVAQLRGTLLALMDDPARLAALHAAARAQPGQAAAGEIANWLCGGG